MASIHSVSQHLSKIIRARGLYHVAPASKFMAVEPFERTEFLAKCAPALIAPGKADFHGQRMGLVR